MGTYIPLDAVQGLDLFRAAVLLPVRIEVGLPVLRRNALALELRRVLLNVWQEFV